uniref:Uncharacterized protein n=1 Tax=Octopus bimaculoides TaxID=37653 RepID=A0A0L8FSY1_OCTBM
MRHLFQTLSDMANELDCSSLELSILQGFTHDDCCESELPVIIGNFLSGYYEAVIADPFTTEVVGGDLEELLPSEIQALVLKNIDSLLSTDTKR